MIFQDDIELRGRPLARRVECSVFSQELRRQALGVCLGPRQKRINLGGKSRCAIGYDNGGPRGPGMTVVIGLYS